MILSQYDPEDSPREIQEQSSLKLGPFKKKNLGSKKQNSKSWSNKYANEPFNNEWKKRILIIVGLLITTLLLYSFWNMALQSYEKKCKEAADKQTKKSQISIKAEQEKVHKLTTEVTQLNKQIEKLKKTIESQAKSATPSTTPTGTNLPAQVSKDAKGAPSNVENPNVVIDVTYDEKDYLSLPVDLLRKNKEGKGIGDILYKTDDIRRKREEFQKQRISYIDSKTNFPQLYLAKFNLALDQDSKKAGVVENEKQWARLNDKFHFNDIKPELPMCIVVPGYNNNANYRIEYNLNSIFMQNYTNYKVVVINDASNDGSDEVYRKYFAFNRIDKGRYFYIENSKRVTALQNIYLVSMNQCSKDSIVVTIDADDEFIGRNVLNVFNWGYQTKKSGVIYTNFFWYQQPQTLMYGFTSQYNQNEKKNNLYRNSPMKFSHLRSYRTELLYQIDPKDLQDQKGVFFTIAYDMALFFPLMELSCGRVNKIEGEFHYLYNTGTGLNDYNDRGRQVAVDNRVRAQKKYQCYKDFNQRMSK